MVYIKIRNVIAKSLQRRALEWESVLMILHCTPVDYLSFLAGIHPTELHPKGVTMSLAYYAMETGHLFHSALTYPLSGNAGHPKSRHPFVPAAQQLVSSYYNNKSVAFWTNHLCKVECLDNNTRLCTCIPEISTHTLGMILPRNVCVQLSISTLVSDFSDPGYTNDVSPFCGLWVWHTRTDHWPRCPPMSNPPNSLRSAWRFWVMRQLNDCSTSAPRSSAA